MISAKDMGALRLIAQAGDDYEQIKRLVAAEEWKILEDNAALGYMSVTIPRASSPERYRLIIGYRDPEHPAYSLLSFFLFPDSQEHIAAFNSAFHSVSDAIKRILGTP